MLEIKDTCLLVIDVQEKLLPVINRWEKVARNIGILLNAMREISIPVLVTEQLPEKIGQTYAPLREILGDDYHPVWKDSFSCCGSDNFRKTLDEIQRKNILICGIEAHVCVYQTAMDLKENWNIHLVTDAVSSRAKGNRKRAVQKMASSGIECTGTEMLLFELMRKSTHPSFKKILNLIK